MFPSARTQNETELLKAGNTVVKSNNNVGSQRCFCVCVWVSLALFRVRCFTERQIVGIVSLQGCEPVEEIHQTPESAHIAGKWGQAFAAAAACKTLTENRPACQYSFTLSPSFSLSLGLPNLSSWLLVLRPQECNVRQLSYSCDK